MRIVDGMDQNIKLFAGTLLLLFRPSCPFPRISRQRSDTPTRENSHDPKARVEQRQRIHDKPPHTVHPSNGAKHATRAHRTPADRHTRHNVAKTSIKIRNNTNKRRNHEWEKTVSQHTGGARVRQGRREMGRADLLALRGIGGRRGGHGGVEGRGHEGEDRVQTQRAEEGEPVNVAEVHFSGLRERC